MLSSLFVSDLALIRRLSVDFHRGFSVLTGETGGGKSLVLDAFSLILEPRAPKELVREGAERTEVSLFFDELSPETKAALADSFSAEELEEGVTLSRTVTAEGNSTCRAGGRTVPASRLSEIARTLLSLQGQGAAGGLFDQKNHRRYLDSALTKEEAQRLEEYRRVYREYTREKSALAELESQTGNEKEKIELWDYQMREIARVKPKAGEEDALEAKLSSLQNVEKLHAALYTADRALSGGEKGKGARFLLEAAAGRLASLGESDPQFALSGELYEIARRVGEIAGDVSFRLAETGEEDPADLSDRIRRRLDALYQLKQKYGGTVEDVIAYYAEIARKKDLTLSLKDDIKRASAALAAREKELFAAAETVTAARRRAAKQLEEDVHALLAFLDMPKTRFFAEVAPVPPGPDGADAVSFLLSANTGEGIKPLALVASGGEGSRVMLALHLKLGKAKDADTMVFDEIDTGVSGATAQKIGIALKTLARTRQILCVTHSAQVSTLADRHYLVKKAEKDGRTETSVTLLDETASLMENARLFSGATLTEEARDAAQELRSEGLREFEKWKNTVF